MDLKKKKAIDQHNCQLYHNMNISEKNKTKPKKNKIQMVVLLDSSVSLSGPNTA